MVGLLSFSGGQSGNLENGWPLVFMWPGTRDCKTPGGFFFKQLCGNTIFTGGKRLVQPETVLVCYFWHYCEHDHIHDQIDFSPPSSAVGQNENIKQSLHLKKTTTNQPTKQKLPHQSKTKLLTNPPTHIQTLTDHSTLEYETWMDLILSWSVVGLKPVERVQPHGTI